ncbi:cyclic AMP-dependent transcription factor ATF-2 isoform X1 [Drosophila miranda]|uniref:cyclic AMP-dependent transcription factor ATF-2 isoform X1 n=1 Tax=Drosophila miranda TaxID=7229 RepID=UPI0007E7628C|nr:cyclic AMP-dependent transcription factor ATF-2 isoform X1 [Drosophila miranda]
MENSAGIGDLASVSFADFGTKTSGEDGTCYESYGQQPKHDMTLNLSLGQKENLFAADQTPTPTRLIKNCDEVGLFEDLQHVNPFDIGFQRAAEQNVSGTPNRPEAPQNDSESLHTPQVYPLETVSVHTTAPPPVPVGTVMRSESCSSIDVEQLLASDTTTATTAVCAEDPLPIQLIQPQVIAWVLPAQTVPMATELPSGKHLTSSIPGQSGRPFILPKPSTRRNTPAPLLVSSNPTAPEPSSASLTPTSQLPIKERLKAIIHSNNQKRIFSEQPKSVRAKPDRDEDCMERRRAAASRYRNKMRNEQKDLRKQNAQLQQENQDLRERIARLEKELNQHNNSMAGVVANQLKIPPSSIHLLINVPSMLVPSSAQNTSVDIK